MSERRKYPVGPWLLGSLALGGAVWYATIASFVPLCLVLGTACALFSLAIAERGEARHGRRVPVTEMIPLGLQGDRAMLAGGIAGYLMLGFFILAGWLAF